MELNRVKRRISRVKGQTTSREQLELHHQKDSLSAELDDARRRRHALAKQTVKLQVHVHPSLLHFLHPTTHPPPYCIGRSDGLRDALLYSRKIDHIALPT